MLFLLANYYPCSSLLGHIYILKNDIVLNRFCCLPSDRPYLLLHNFWAISAISLNFKRKRLWWYRTLVGRLLLLDSRHWPWIGTVIDRLCPRFVLWWVCLQLRLFWWRIRRRLWFCFRDWIRSLWSGRLCLFCRRQSLRGGPVLTGFKITRDVLTSIILQLY